MTWFSEDTSIATVDSNGRVRGISPGFVGIRARTTDGSHDAWVLIAVVAANVPVTGVSIAGATTRELNIGQNIQLTAMVNPSDATTRNVTWTSSNTNVATVSPGGNVRAVSAGSTIITVRTADGGREARVNVNVLPNPILPTGVNIAGDSTRNVNVDESFQLVATVTPANATNRNVTWTSTNSSIASVDSNGNVRANSAGTVNIVARTEVGGREARVTVNVDAVNVPTPPVNDNVTGISVRTMPTRRSFSAFETIDVGGLSLNVNWSSERTTVVTSGFDISYRRTPGTQLVTVTYQGNTTTFEVARQIELHLSTAGGGFTRHVVNQNAYR